MRGERSRRGEKNNEERPHSSLGYQTPREFAARVGAAEADSALGAASSSAAQLEMSYDHVHEKWGQVMPMSQVPRDEGTAAKLD